jgi:protein Mpv17
VVIQANFALWIPAQIVNFSLVPLNYQVLFGNVVALLWNVYLSWVNATTRTPETPHGVVDMMPTSSESGMQ